MDFEQLLEPIRPELQQFEEFLSSSLQQTASVDAGIDRLLESMRYSLEGPGKRFRPLVAVLTAKSLAQPAARVFGWAAAVEYIHTYSLIHDDLPCMDNDEMRRGKATNHKVFGEDFALLAGDALLTESFGLLCKHYAEEPMVVSQLVACLARAAGVRGMIGGQALDIYSSNQPADNEALVERLHRMKTAALIAVAAEGAAVAAGATEAQQQALVQFGEELGFAFQLADDIEDFDPSHPEPVSMVNHLGMEGTHELLDQVGRSAVASLHQAVPEAADSLAMLVEFNARRIPGL